MNNRVQRQFVVSAVALLSLIAGWNISEAEDASVAGVYLLMEVNGEQLPANLWTENLDGERCRQVILKGVLLLDSEGRSSAFLTERVFCPSEDASENGGKEQSVILAGTYAVSRNQQNALLNVLR